MMRGFADSRVDGFAAAVCSKQNVVHFVIIENEPGISQAAFLKRIRMLNAFSHRMTAIGELIANRE